VSEIVLGENDRLDVALKKFRKKVERSGVLRELRKRRHYVKPSMTRRLKDAAAVRRNRMDAKRAARHDH
jgi:small subunit ribosomal protein S21